MGERQDTMIRMFAAAGHAASSGLERPSARSRASIDGDAWAEIMRVYRELGGVLDSCPMQTGVWDLQLGGSVAVELDQEQHFNRYRAVTLASSHYSDDRFPLEEYRQFCRSYERECISKASNRGYWANTSTVSPFGPAGPLRDLNPPGAPRWKQRAFYDYLKDLSPLLCHTPVARLAIWDTLEVEGARMTVKDALDKHRRKRYQRCLT